jgi:hypothetical protein
MLLTNPMGNVCLLPPAAFSAVIKTQKLEKNNFWLSSWVDVNFFLYYDFTFKKNAEFELE